MTRIALALTLLLAACGGTTQADLDDARLKRFAKACGLPLDQGAVIGVDISEQEFHEGMACAFQAEARYLGNLQGLPRRTTLEIRPQFPAPRPTITCETMPGPLVDRTVCR